MTKEPTFWRQPPHPDHVTVLDPVKIGSIPAFFGRCQTCGEQSAVSLYYAGQAQSWRGRHIEGVRG